MGCLIFNVGAIPLNSFPNVSTQGLGYDVYCLSDQNNCYVTAVHLQSVARRTWIWNHRKQTSCWPESDVNLEYHQGNPDLAMKPLRLLSRKTSLKKHVETNSCWGYSPRRRDRYPINWLFMRMVCMYLHRYFYFVRFHQKAQLTKKYFS